MHGRAVPLPRYDNNTREMKRLFALWPAILVIGIAMALLAQRADDRFPRRREAQGPELKIKPEDILKEDYKKSLQDAGELVKLAEEIKADLEKNDRHVLSLTTLKKTEEIEKVARRLRTRLRKF